MRQPERMADLVQEQVEAVIVEGRRDDVRAIVVEARRNGAMSREFVVPPKPEALSAWEPGVALA